MKEERRKKKEEEKRRRKDVKGEARRRKEKKEVKLSMEGILVILASLLTLEALSGMFDSPDWTPQTWHTRFVREVLT